MVYGFKSLYFPAISRSRAICSANCARPVQAAFKQFALDKGGLPVSQLVPVDRIAGAHDQLQLWEMLFGQIDNLQQAINHYEFNSYKSKQYAGYQPWRVDQNGEINAHADGNEEES